MLFITVVIANMYMHSSIFIVTQQNCDMTIIFMLLNL